MNRNAYRNTHLVCLDVRNMGRGRVVMWVPEQLMRVEVLILHKHRLYLLLELPVQELLQNHSLFDSDTQDFFEVLSR